MAEWLLRTAIRLGGPREDARDALDPLGVRRDVVYAVVADGGSGAIVGTVS